MHEQIDNIIREVNGTAYNYYSSLQKWKMYLLIAFLLVFFATLVTAFIEMFFDKNEERVMALKSLYYLLIVISTSIYYIIHLFAITKPGFSAKKQSTHIDNIISQGNKIAQIIISRFTIKEIVDYEGIIDDRITHLSAKWAEHNSTLLVGAALAWGIEYIHSRNLNMNLWQTMLTDAFISAAITIISIIAFERFCSKFELIYLTNRLRLVRTALSLNN
jgi:hypothetical protein